MREPKPQSSEPQKGDDHSPATPPSGPHAKPELTNDEATPGAGSLPSNDDGGDADEGAG